MPIRFRCAYCNQLMGISHRKMGAIVRCPKCAGQIVVPQVDDAPDDAPPFDGGMAAAVKVIEGPQLEMQSAGIAGEANAVGKYRPQQREAPPRLLEVELVPLELRSPSTGAPALAKPARLPSAWATSATPVTLPRWVLVSVAVAVLLLLGLAFAVGYALGGRAAF